MKFFRRINKLILILVFPALCLLFYNNTANWHLHQLKQGIITEHAHPFSKQADSNTPFQKHKHSTSEYFILDSIFNFLLILIISLFFLKIILNSSNVNNNPVQLLVNTREFWFGRNYRGPPSI